MPAQQEHESIARQGHAHAHAATLIKEHMTYLTLQSFEIQVGPIPFAYVHVCVRVAKKCLEDSQALHNT